MKSRARLEREQSKPSESDTEPDVDTVTVEIPKRRKRPRRISEKPRTPPTSIVSDSEGEVNHILYCKNIPTIRNIVCKIFTLYIKNERAWYSGDKIQSLFKDI